MPLSLQAGLCAGMLLAVAPLSLAGQDSTTMKKDSMDHGAMAPSMGGHHDMGKLRDGMMMPPHGMFAGDHDHKVSGGYSIVEKGGKQSLVLADDFLLDGAPDPYVVLSADDMGSGGRTLNLGALTRKKGSSTFAIPAGTDLAQYTHVLVWCKKYNVTLGSAALAAGGAMMQN